MTTPMKMFRRLRRRRPQPPIGLMQVIPPGALHRSSADYDMQAHIRAAVRYAELHGWWRR